MAVVATVVAGCALFGRTPPGGDPPYVSMRLCGAAFDGRAKEARLSIDLDVMRPLPPASVIEVSFDSPLDSARPLTGTRTVAGSERALRVLSQPVKGLDAREYGMVVRLYRAGDRTAPFATYALRCSVPVAYGDVGVEYR